MIPRAFIEDLLTRIDLIAVIERYLPLKKKGINYFACCPFHGEKTPSFSVSPTKQFYHCFGCGVHGNAINFLMEYSGLSFIDAVEELARQYGLAVPREHTPGAAARPSAAQLDPLIALSERAATFYRAQLKQNPEAIAYLKKRGLSGEIVARFGIGYAPDDWQALRTEFGTDYEDDALLSAGLVIESEQQRRYDRFRGRIMFPILDRRGRTIAFGGRVLGAGEPKYLNSSETPLFEKGRELYGLSQALKPMREAGHVLVVEGYMDVVALAQFGAGNAVATLGTATTAHHLTTLMRLTERIVFCFDGDAAGRKAAWRALENALEALRDDISLAFLFLPAEHDPDSFVRAEGIGALRAAAAAATPLTRFLLDELSAAVDLGSPEGRAHFAHAARPLVSRIGAPLLRQQLVKSVAELASLTVDELEDAWAQYGDSRPAPASAIATAPVAPAVHRTTPLRPSVRRRSGRSPAATLLRLVLNQPHWALRLPADFIPRRHADGQALLAIIDAMGTGELEDDCSLAVLVEHFRDTPHGLTLSKVAAELLEGEFDDTVLDALFDDTLRKLHTDAIDREVTALTEAARSGSLNQEQRLHLAQLLQQKRSLSVKH